MSPPNAVPQVMAHRYGVTALVLVAVAALYGVAELTRPSDAPGHAVSSQVPVESAVLVCPDSGGSRVSVLAPPNRRKGGGADVVQSATGTPVGTLTGAGHVSFWEVGNAVGPLTVRASGAAAAGLTTEQTTLTKSGDDRGLAAVRCEAPGTDLWFLGPGPVEAKKIELHLANVDDQPAAVDTRALSDNGPLDTEGRGMTIDPHVTRVIGIGDSPEGRPVQAQVLALHVHATAGRIAAAVRVRMDKGKGVDWVPVAGAPATRLVVPGLPGGSGQRRLLIAVPGDTDAKVRVQVITPAGAFAPGGQDTLVASAQTVTPLPLTGALSGKPAAIRLTADRPILAAFTADLGDDVAYGAAVPPLTPANAMSPGGLVADDRTSGGATSTVLLTAPDRAATVRLTAITAQGPAGSPQVVTVAATRTLEVRLGSPAGVPDGFGVLVSPQPGSGPVYAAQVLSVGKFVTVLPIPPAATTVTMPPVGNSLTALLP